jgi:hypothetical protein
VVLLHLAKHLVLLPQRYALTALLALLHHLAAAAAAAASCPDS